MASRSHVVSIASRSRGGHAVLTLEDAAIATKGPSPHGRTGDTMTGTLGGMPAGVRSSGQPVAGKPLILRRNVDPRAMSW